MSTFFMFGKYSLDGLKGMSTDRTGKIKKVIEGFGGNVKSMHALLGESDLIFIAGFPGAEQAMQASVALTKQTNISFSTSPAVTVEEFDNLTADI